MTATEVSAANTGDAEPAEALLADDVPTPGIAEDRDRARRRHVDVEPLGRRRRRNSFDATLRHGDEIDRLHIEAQVAGHPTSDIQNVVDDL